MASRLILHFNISPDLIKQAEKNGDVFFLEVFIDGVMSIQVDSKKLFPLTEGTHALCCVVHCRNERGGVESSHSIEPYKLSVCDGNAEVSVNVQSDMTCCILAGNVGISSQASAPTRHRSPLSERLNRLFAKLRRRHEGS